MNEQLRSQLISLLFLLPAIVVGFTVHEAAHAFVAVKLGDDTPRLNGRLTLNPAKHIDIIGLVMILVFRFGWAKPVEYNPAKLKKPVEHSLLIAMAGPVANLLTAVLLMGLYAVLCRLSFPFAAVILGLVYVAAWMNASLFIFNLIPLPPLDGSHVVFWAIPGRYQEARAAFLKYGYFVLLGLILVQGIANFAILPIPLMTDNLIGLIGRLFRVPAL